MRVIHGIPAPDLWIDMLMVVRHRAKKGKIIPLKNLKLLLERIIQASSNPGDMVLDCFIGSGTTVAVAQKMGRRWIGCDINKGAIQTTSKRIIRYHKRANHS